MKLSSNVLMGKSVWAIKSYRVSGNRQPLVAV